MAKQLGQPVVVDNRPGGALTIGIDAVAKSTPDGYTVGMGPVGRCCTMCRVMASATCSPWR